MSSELESPMDRDDLLDIFNSVKNFSEQGSAGNDNTESDTLDGLSCCSSQSTELTDDHEEKALDAQDNCRKCGTDSLVYEDGAYFCHLCGELQDVRINQEQEWRYYGDSDSKSTDPTRVGMPVNALLPESSLGTIISNRGSHSAEFDKIRQFHSWNTMPYKERSLFRVYEKLQSAVKAGIPPCIIDNAKALYKMLSEKSITRGANRRGLMASCVYISCKMEDVPRSAKEIADIYGLKVNEMTKGCKKFMEIMNETKKRKEYVINSSTPLNFIKRFCSNLDLSQDIRHICEYVAFMTTKLDIVDENTPPSIAAGSIFLVLSLCNVNISKKAVSQACLISEVTISKCFKKLHTHRQQLLPPEVIHKYQIPV